MASRIRATGPGSAALSKALRNRSWTFVGPTTVHTSLQAIGMVNDHAEGCVTRGEVEEARAEFVRPGGRNNSTRSIVR